MTNHNVSFDYSIFLLSEIRRFDSDSLTAAEYIRFLDDRQATALVEVFDVLY